MYDLLNHLLLFGTALITGLICWKSGYPKSGVLAFFMLELGYLLSLSVSPVAGLIFVVPGAIVVLWVGRQKAMNESVRDSIDSDFTAARVKNDDASLQEYDVSFSQPSPPLHSHARPHASSD